MKVSKDFDIREFVPPSIWLKYGERSIYFIDVKIINFAQWLRDKTGCAVTINNWHIGGSFSNSGFRLPDSDVGAPFSQHKFGRGIDCKIEGWSGDKMRRFVMENWQEAKAFISTIEDGTSTWLHVDCRQTNIDDILIVPFFK